MTNALPLAAEAADIAVSATDAGSQLPRWDLSRDFYASPRDPKLAQDIQDALEQVRAFEQTYKRTIINLNGDEMADMYDALAPIYSLVGNIYRYSSLLESIDATNPDVRWMSGWVGEQLAPLGQHLLFMTLEMSKIPPEELERRMQESPRLAAFESTIRDHLQGRKYLLSDDKEQLLVQLSAVGDNSIADFLEEDRVRWRYELNGESLTETQLGKYTTAADEATRKAAMEARYKTLEDKKHLPVAAMNGLIQEMRVRNEQIRGYDGPMASRNASNQVGATEVEAMIEAVKENYVNASHRYLALKAELLGKAAGEKLNYWDEPAPLPTANGQEVTISWEEARDIVLETFYSFSQEFGDIAKEFFDNNWIDAEPRAGKRGGAFSMSGTKTMHPFVLVNYQGRPDDVSTLAHELGHAIHQTLEARKQHALELGTPLTLAETASIFAEELTFRKLMERIPDVEAKIRLLADSIEGGLGTIDRQTQYVEFERRIHAERAEQGPLSAERFGEIWSEVWHERTGGQITPMEGFENDWTRIPHIFRTPFYVYAYTFGNLLVNALITNFDQAADKEAFVAKYTELLASGGTRPYEELLEMFGLDASNKQFWKDGLAVLNHKISELEVLVQQQRDAAKAEAAAPANDNAVTVIAGDEATRSDLAKAVEQQDSRAA